MITREQRFFNRIDGSKPMVRALCGLLADTQENPKVALLGLGDKFIRLLSKLDLARAAKARKGQVPAAGSFSALAQKPYSKDQVLLTHALEEVSDLLRQKANPKAELDDKDKNYIRQFSEDDLILLNNGLQKILGAYLRKMEARQKAAKLAAALTEVQAQGTKSLLASWLRL